MIGNFRRAGFKPASYDCGRTRRELSNLGTKLRASEVIGWKATPLPVIPAEAGIQAVFEFKMKTNLDAGIRRHDERSLCLKHARSGVEGASDFHDPEVGH